VARRSRKDMSTRLPLGDAAGGGPPQDATGTAAVVPASAPAAALAAAPDPCMLEKHQNEVGHDGHETCLPEPAASRGAHGGAASAPTAPPDPHRAKPAPDAAATAEAGLVHADKEVALAAPHSCAEGAAAFNEARPSLASASTVRAPTR